MDKKPLTLDQIVKAMVKKYKLRTWKDEAYRLTTADEQFNLARIPLITSLEWRGAVAMGGAIRWGLTKFGGEELAIETQSVHRFVKAGRNQVFEQMLRRGYLEFVGKWQSRGCPLKVYRTSFMPFTADRRISGSVFAMPPPPKPLFLPIDLYPEDRSQSESPLSPGNSWKSARVLCP